MQRKRSPISVDQTGFMNLTTKRLKTDVPLSSREKKEKVGERIAALQQLVSPFGKTDMASVLLEAIQYINFLNDQVKVLVAPYLYATMAETQNDGQSSSLEAQGLCVVPISLTVGVVSSNGADLWAPIKTGASNSRGTSSDEASIITL